MASFDASRPGAPGDAAAPTPPADVRDDGAGPLPRDREPFLRDPQLQEDLRRFIARKVPAADVEDVLQETLTAIAFAPDFPADPDRRRGFAFGTAKKKIADHWRRARRQPPTSDGAEVEHVAEAVPGDPVSNRDFLAKLVRLIPSEHFETLQWMARRVLGETLAEIAREARLDYDVVRKRVDNLEQHMRVVGQALVVLLVVTVVGGSWHRMRKPPAMAYDEPPMPTFEPAAPTPEPEPEPTEGPDDWQKPINEADGLRQLAYQECLQNQWLACLRDLDEARAIWPAGDDQPAVKAARKDIADALVHAEDKHWSPPRVRKYPPPEKP